MDLYTYQIARWRLVKARGIVAMDTTVKSGVWWVAPEWSIVMGVKQGTITPQQYTQAYLAWLDYSWHQYPMLWDELFTLPAVALGCYCSAGKFCHRHLLKTFILTHHAGVDHGEITS